LAELHRQAAHFNTPKISRALKAITDLMREETEYQTL